MSAQLSGDTMTAAACSAVIVAFRIAGGVTRPPTRSAGFSVFDTVAEKGLSQPS